MCLKICELNSSHFFVPELAWQVALKMIKVKLDLKSDIDMLLMVEKGIVGGMCHVIQWYAKAESKCIMIKQRIFVF